MRLLIFIGLFAITFADDLRKYAAPKSNPHFENFSSTPSRFFFKNGGSSRPTGVSSLDGAFSGHNILHSNANLCSDDKVRNALGSCVTPIVNRKFFLYIAPPSNHTEPPPPEVPEPTVDINFVLVRSPELPMRPGLVVVPPPQQKTHVYVLSKNDPLNTQKVIEVPHKTDDPEVFYINYNEGENPNLPGGIDLQSALQSAESQQRKVKRPEDHVSKVRSSPTQRFGSLHRGSYTQHHGSATQHHGIEAHLQDSSALQHESSTQHHGSATQHYGFGAHPQDYGTLQHEPSSHHHVSATHHHGFGAHPQYSGTLQHESSTQHHGFVPHHPQGLGTMLHGSSTQNHGSLTHRRGSGAHPQDSGTLQDKSRTQHHDSAIRHRRFGVPHRGYGDVGSI